MRFLLDTCTFLWMASAEERLSERARSLLVDSDNHVFLSAVSSWEMAIKAEAGKLSIEDPTESFVQTALSTKGIEPLAVTHAHAWRTASLPRHHRDPFDRLLVAQAQVERLVLLTPDRAFAKYDVEAVW